MDQWRQQIYPEILRRARAKGARIYFADAAGMRSDYQAGTTWAPAAGTPVGGTPGARFAVNMSSAVAPTGEMRSRLGEGTVDESVFADFIDRLADDAADRKVFLIVDGHPSHRSRVVLRKLRELARQVELFSPPPYSPECNPDELVWEHVKRQIGRAAVADKDDLRQRISSALQSLQSLQKMPARIMVFFRHPECQYAAESGSTRCRVSHVARYQGHPESGGRAS